MQKQVAYICVAILVMVSIFHTFFKLEAYDQGAEAEYFAENAEWNVPSPTVEVYDAVGISGKSKFFSRPVDDLKLHGFDDVVRSLIVGPFTVVTLYEHPQLKGRKHRIVNTSEGKLTVNDIGEIMRNRVSSIDLRFVNPFFVGFDQANRGGDFKILGASAPTLAEFNGRIQSFVAGPFTQTVLYDEPGFKGREKVYENTGKSALVVDYVGRDWASNVRSVKIESLFNV